MLYGDGSRDIVDQDVEFAKTADDIFRKNGRTNEAVHELINICKAKDILREYLTSKESEVFTIMTTLFDQEKITESYGRRKYNDGMETGEARQLVNSVNAVMKIYNVPIEKTCEDFGKTTDDYNKAKNLLENSKTYA